MGILSQLVRYLRFLKVDADAVLRSVGIDPALLRSPDARLPFERYIAAEDAAAALTEDPCFGLHMGEHIEPGHYSIIGYMMMNSPTLGEALGRAGRYYRIIGNLISGRVQLGLGTVKMIYEAPKNAPPISRHCFECAIASSLTLARRLTGRRIDPREVGFTSEPPQSTAEYARVFRAPVLFKQKHNYLIVDTRLGKTPILQPNAQLLAYFEGIAREYLAGIEQYDATTRGVVRVILSRLDSRRLDIREVAREMAMSVRTLQARLKDEGMIFRELLEETRERLAKKFLRESWSVEEIACMLGYAETSVFSRAFRKWSGQSPMEYRTLSSPEPEKLLAENQRPKS